MNDMVGELRGPILSAAQRQAMGIVGAPSAHHGVGNLRVELNADRGRPVCVGLIGEWAIASGKQCGAVRKLQAFPMPLVDPFRPGAKSAGTHGRPDKVVTDLDVLFGMLINPRAEIIRHHLRAEADTEKWLVLE